MHLGTLRLAERMPPVKGRFEAPFLAKASRDGIFNGARTLSLQNRKRNRKKLQRRRQQAKQLTLERKVSTAELFAAIEERSNIFRSIFDESNS